MHVSDQIKPPISLASLAMSADSRGILRGHCQACNCGAYSGGEKGFKCSDCGHPPGKHVNLSTSASSSTTRQVRTPPRPQAVPSVHSVTSSLARVTPPTPVPRPPTTFAIGPQCQFPGCSEEAHFDLNLMKQYPYCKDHISVDSLTLQLHNAHIDPLEYGEPLNYPTSYPQVAATNGSVQPGLISPFRPYQPPPNAAPPLSSLSSQSTPNLMMPPPQPFLSLPPKTSPSPHPRKPRKFPYSIIYESYNLGLLHIQLFDRLQCISMQVIEVGTA